MIRILIEAGNDFAVVSFLNVAGHSLVHAAADRRLVVERKYRSVVLVLLNEDEINRFPKGSTVYIYTNIGVGGTVL
jgi:predicted Zn-dependent protease